MNFFKLFINVFLVCSTNTFFLAPASAQEAVAAPGRKVYFFIKGMTASYNRTREVRAIPLEDLGEKIFSFPEANLTPDKGLLSEVIEALESREMASLYGGLVLKAWPTLPDSVMFTFVVDIKSSTGKSFCHLHLADKSPAEQLAFVESMQAEWKSVEGRQYAGNELIVPVYLVAVGIERGDLVQESDILPDETLSAPASLVHKVLFGKNK